MNWHSVDERLVRHGEILLSPEPLEKYEEEKTMDIIGRLRGEPQWTRMISSKAS
jgi:hypothetical protein